LVPAIQAVDSRHLIFFEAPVLTDFGAPETIGGPAFGALPFGGLVVNFHDYGFAGSAVSGFTSPGTGECSTPDCGPQETLTMTQFETARAATQTNQPDGPAWFMSEFGGEDGGTDIARVAGLADSTPVN